MAYIGFLFERVFGEDEIVVFVEKEKLKSNIVVGTKSKVILEDVKNAMILGKDLSLKPFPVFHDSKFLYGKISVSKETFIDYEHMTIWFNANKYKQLKQLFEEEFDNTSSKKEREEELKKRVVDIYTYFR